MATAFFYANVWMLKIAQCIIFITNISHVLTEKLCKYIISLNDDGDKIRRKERDNIFMEKKWPAYIAMVIICIPLFVVLGFAEELSMALLSAAISVIMLVVPIILAWIIGYMDDVKSFAANFKDPEIGKRLTYKEDFALRRAIWNPIIIGVLCGISFVFTDTFCEVITFILAIIIAVKVKRFICEYKEMKELLKDRLHNESDAE